MSRVLKLFENKLIIEIPDNYIEIQDEENIFASSEKPNYILKNDTLDSYITITKSTIEMKDSLELTFQGLYNQYRRVIPNFKPSGLYYNQLETVKVGAFQFGSTTATKDLYTLVALFALDGKQTLITMHCDIKDAFEEGNKYMKLVESIKVNK